MIKVVFSLFLKMSFTQGLENCEFALEVHSNHGQQKARKMWSKDENSYVMLVELKSYVKGMLTHCQQ